MTYTVLNINSYIAHRVHKAGCRDIATERTKNRNCDTWDFEANTAIEGIREEVGDPDDETSLISMGYGEDSFELAPCAK